MNKLECLYKIHNKNHVAFDNTRAENTKTEGTILNLIYMNSNISCIDNVNKSIAMTFLTA